MTWGKDNTHVIVHLFLVCTTVSIHKSQNPMAMERWLIILTGIAQWRSQRGGRGWLPPLAETLPPFCPPNEITLCTEVYGELPFWVPVNPPISPLSPPCRPLIMKSLATYELLITIQHPNQYICAAIAKVVNWSHFSLITKLSCWPRRFTPKD